MLITSFILYAYVTDRDLKKSSSLDSAVAIIIATHDFDTCANI